MEKEKLSSQESFSKRLEKQVDAFSQKHPNVIKNTARIGGAITLLTSTIVGGAIWEKRSIQEVLAENDRQPLCHSGNGKNWNIIQPSEQSYDAHIKDWEGPAQGHDHDYFASDKNGDGQITEEDCGFEPSPTPIKTFTPIPTLTPEITATFMPSPTVIFTPTETRPSPTGTQATPTEVKPTPTEIKSTPTKSSTSTEALVCPPEEDCYCEKVVAGTVAAAILNAQATDTAGEIKAAQMQIDAANERATDQAKTESTATPSGLISNQPEIPVTNRDKKSPLDTNVLAGAGGLVTLTALGAAEVIRRKKKS